MKIKNEIWETEFENISFMPVAKELTHKLKYELKIKMLWLLDKQNVLFK